MARGHTGAADRRPRAGARARTGAVQRAGAGGHCRVPLLGRSALRAVRHPLPRSGAQPLQLQLTHRRLPDLPRFRAGHRDRLGPRGPGRVALPEGRRGQAVAEQELRRVPARSPAVRSPARYPGRRPLGRPQRRGALVGDRRRGRLAGGCLVRSKAVLRLARGAQLQDAHPRPPVALPGVPDLPRLQRGASQAGGAPVADPLTGGHRRSWRPHDPRSAPRADLVARTVLRLDRGTQR